MAATQTLLIQPKFAEATLTTQYTSPANGRGTIIDKFTAVNTDGGTATISVHLVSDGAASDNDVVARNASLHASAAYTFPEVVGHFLRPGDSIATVASSAGVISIRASGRELT
jgi:hypothetical protein